MTPQTIDLSHFPSGLQKFRPCAFVDERLDCIRVIARDCSVIEERINSRVTVLVDTYSGTTRDYVGFTIKGARHFCQENGWNINTSLTVSAFLNALVRSSPDIFVEWFVNFVARPLIEKEQIEEVESELAFA